MQSYITKIGIVVRAIRTKYEALRCGHGPFMHLLFRLILLYYTVQRVQQTISSLPSLFSPSWDRLGIQLGPL